MHKKTEILTHHFTCYPGSKLWEAYQIVTAFCQEINPLCYGFSNSVPDEAPQAP